MGKFKGENFCGSVGREHFAEKWNSKSIVLGDNFHRWLSNREIHESFLPRKFPAIRYCLIGWCPGTKIDVSAH